MLSIYAKTFMTATRSLPLPRPSDTPLPRLSAPRDGQDARG